MTESPKSTVPWPLLMHLIGDYLLQTDAMALKKTKSLWWAAFHAATYTLPFLALTRHPGRLAIIFGTHTLIDRYRLARYVIAAKNAITDPAKAKEFFESPTGYLTEKHKNFTMRIGETINEHFDIFDIKVDYIDTPGTPVWMSTWLYIIADNTCHMLINQLALEKWE